MEQTQSYYSGLVGFRLHFEFGYFSYTEAYLQTGYATILILNAKHCCFLLLLYNCFFSLTSFLLGFCWMSYSDFVASEILTRNKPSLPITKLIFVHIQLVPLILLPLFIAQIFGRIDLLNTIAIILSSICLTQVFLVPYCLFVAFMGERILNAKFLWMTSIFSLISFANAIYLAFQFIVWNMDYGPLALAIIMSSVFSSALGIILSRVS